SLDRGNDRVGLLRGARVDDDSAVGAELDGDVCASTGEHVDVGPDLYDVEIALRPGANARRGDHGGNGGGRHDSHEASAVSTKGASCTSGAFRREPTRYHSRADARIT